MYLQGCWSVIKLSSSLDSCVFTELLLSEGSLVRGGGYVDVTSVREEGVEGGSNFIRELRG